MKVRRAIRRETGRSGLGCMVMQWGEKLDGTIGRKSEGENDDFWRTGGRNHHAE